MLLLVAGCLAEVPVGPSSGQPIGALDVRRHGLTNASLLAVWTDGQGRTWTGGSAGVVAVRENGTWQPTLLASGEIVTGIWGVPGGPPLIVAGPELWRRVGSSWVNEPLPSDEILLDIWGWDADHVWITGSRGLILRRTANGWLRATVPTTAEVWGVWGDPSLGLVAVGGSGAILESSDGHTWRNVASPTTNTLFGVAGDGAGRVVAVGSSGVILFRDGDVWERANSPTAENLFAVVSNGSGQFMIAGDGGVLLAGDGVSWTRIESSAARANFRGISGTPGARVVAGWSGTVIEEGNGWRTVLAGGPLYGLHAPADGAAIGVGAGGLAYERVNGEWRELLIGAHATLYAITGPSASRRLAVGDSGTVMRFNGVEWFPEPVPATGLLRSVWYDGERAMIVGADGVSLALEGGWRGVSTGTQEFLRHIWGPEWIDLWAAGDHGTLLRFDGTRWRRQPVPATTTLRGVWGRSSRDVWVVGDSGTLLHWDGREWERPTSPTSEDLRAVREIAGHLYLIGSGGHLWRRDGTTWVALSTGIPALLLAIDGTDEVIVVGELALIAEGR